MLKQGQKQPCSQSGRPDSSSFSGVRLRAYHPPMEFRTISGIFEIEESADAVVRPCGGIRAVRIVKLLVGLEFTRTVSIWPRCPVRSQAFRRRARDINAH